VGGVAVGRFAPSPSGPLHLGNLRTALLAWWAARGDGSAHLLRVEDLDPSSRPEHEAGQLADLRALGLDWDGPVVRQSERRDLYEDAVGRLDAAGLTYPCYCTRREIREATRAPHVAPDAYPGTCRRLTAAERRGREADGRPPALRLRSPGEEVAVVDALHGVVRGVVDDVVLRRNDGLPAYNLVVVVDDAAQGVEEVVRGDDLLPSTPRQAHLAHVLGLPVPRYLHVPLVLGPDGSRLAKRHGAVTLADATAAGIPPSEVRRRLAASVGLPDPGATPPPLDRAALPTAATTWDGSWVTP
jgi:glutamyl-tRNA synthetase